jgi:RES domain-containing protein
LPADWQDSPAPESTRRLGLAWYQQQEALALRIPSVLVPLEHNFLIKPTHPRFAEVKVADPPPFPSLRDCLRCSVGSDETGKSAEL